MWVDEASSVDMLFYKPYSDVICKIVEDTEQMTIGLYGGWGTGKSTILKFIEHETTSNDDLVCISLNLWMYEGYENSKSSLMESLLRALESKNSKLKIADGKFKSLYKRIKIFKLGADIVSKGLPILINSLTGNQVPLTFNLFNFIKGFFSKPININENIEKIQEDYLKENEESIIENVSEFRKQFTELLNESKISKVVILVDDLDRCNPEGIIDTLEVIKLFLAVPKTIFVIAVDQKIIEHAIKTKYQTFSNNIDVSKDYIEKIIQLPINIHELSKKDIANYLLILMVQLYIKIPYFENLIIDIQNKRYLQRNKFISVEEINLLLPFEKDIFKENKNIKLFMEAINNIDNIRDIVSSNLEGNPRKAKRFLNTFTIRQELLKLYFTDKINVSILAKLLVLEIIDVNLYRNLYKWSLETEGIIKELKEMVIILKTGEQLSEFKDYKEWGSKSVEKWLLSSPVEIYNEDLSKYFYVSRIIRGGSSDITLICKYCGIEFIFTEGEQAWFAEKGFTGQPVSCSDCRKSRKLNTRRNNY